MRCMLDDAAKTLTGFAAVNSTDKPVTFMLLVNGVTRDFTVGARSSRRVDLPQPRPYADVATPRGEPGWDVDGLEAYGISG